MHARTVLLDIGCRSPFVCRPCLLALQKSPTHGSLIPSRFSSTRAGRKPPASRLPQGPQLRKGKAPAPTPFAQPPQRPPFPVAKEEDDDKDVTIKYFEMDAPGRMRQLRDRDEFAESFELRDEVEKEFAELEELLSKQPPELRQMAERLGLLPKGQGNDDVAKDVEENEDEDIFPHSIDTTGSKRHIRQIHQLNWQLQRTARKIRQGKVTQQTVFNLWRRYSLARPGLQGAWRRVPGEVWRLLWEIVSWEGRANTNRMSRVYQIGKDMRAAGVELDNAQQILLIEAMFVEGLRKEASEAWQRFAAKASALDAPDTLSPELLEEFLKLGVRMYSIQGDIERASRAMEKILESPLRSDPRFLFPFIRACCAAGGASPSGAGRADSRSLEAKSAALESAWLTYRRLRDLLGENMKIEDYDEVVSCFLLAGQTESALHVFVDMMFSGAIDLHGKTKLPYEVANHFFLGKWLKRLIGAGDLDGALSVLKFMQTKGILAATIQVNGLIGAWLRSETAENVDRAEQLTWAMIRSRLMFVDLRRRESLIEWPLRLFQSTGTSKLPPPSTPHRDKSPLNAEESNGGERKDETTALGLTFVPHANLETFSLMAQNYRERRLHSQLEELWVAFQDTEIATDAFMMNQLLESYAQEGEGERAREVYFALTENHSLTPDAYTFFALYKTLAVNRLYWSAVTDQIKHEEAALCRELFSEMLSCSWTFENGEIREALARIVLHSFRKCNDHVGFLVALRALRDVFGCSPDRVTSMEMLAETPDLRHAERKLAAAARVLLGSSRLAGAQATASSPGTAAAGAVGGGEVVGGGASELRHRDKETLLVDHIERYYRSKIDVPEEEFQAMYDEAVREMGLGGVVREVWRSG